MQLSKSILIAAVAVLTPLASHAAPITTNPSLSVSGLNFGNFSCTLTRGGALATPYDCSEVNVNTISNPAGIEITSGFGAILGFDDAVVKYSVSSASTPIHSVGLFFDGAFDGMAISRVTESVFSGQTLVGTATVSCGAYAGCSQTDNIVLNGWYSSLNVEKDIYVAAGAGDATVSIIDQTFDVASAPEPSSMALFGSGILGAALFLRRRIKLGRNAEAAV